MPHKGKIATLKKIKAQERLGLKEENDNCEQVPSKKAKIIVRNLPFKNLSEETLHDVFKEYGEIVEVKILKKSDGKFVGCGFVLFKKMTSAARAIYHANETEINGRKIAVDWALPKDIYLEKVKNFSCDNNIKKENLSDEETGHIKYSIDKEPDTWISNCGRESDEDANDEDENNDDNDDDDDDYDYDYNYDDSKDESIGNNESCQDKKPPIKKSCDAEDGRTVFLRNVPFSATNEDLKKCVEIYGPINYALICVDKLTEHSKGTAFVRFKDPESARQCVQDSMKLQLLENSLIVNYALTKENVENKKSTKKTGKDSRNLYLVREGVIVAGSKAAAGVSAADMSKRLQLEQWKSQILKNLNMFVSKTRLVVHNLPPTYDDSKLKELFLKHGNPNAVIREARVMWERKKLDSEGKRISKEVGFVSFTNHEDALVALRNINNNPKIFLPSKRPIVAFSIENREVLKQKEKRVEKSRIKLGVTIDEKLSRLNRKQRRFIRRRQKYIDKRREAKQLQKGINSEVKTKVGDSEIGKRKRNNVQAITAIGSKKRKLNQPTQVTEPKNYTGIASEPGKKIKLRSRFNLKKQAIVHKQTLKKEKDTRKKKMAKKKLESIRQPKQKQGKKKLLDDSKLSRLISKHRESIEKSSTFKKWYDK